MDIKNKKWKCRYAPSLGGLEGDPKDVWGTDAYDPFQDDTESAVFFGLYGLPDFYTLWRHKGRSAILWAGSDIGHFINGYWLDDKGLIRVDPEPLAEWINKNCENYVENGVEHEALMVFGIESKIVPSFLGNVSDYEISYEHNERPKVYMSVSGDNFEMYGWDIIERIADKCNVDFYLYGNTKPWESKHSNVFVRGRISKEEMNDEIKTMQCGLRTLQFDGCSEIVVKGCLWGHHVISYIGYPNVESFSTEENLIKKLNMLQFQREPNLKARDWMIKNLNRYPWNTNIQKKEEKR